MLARFFIDRPVFAWVLALMTMLAGAWSFLSLPVSQYPDIAPTTVRVSASYPGATAEAVENSVTRVIEVREAVPAPLLLEPAPVTFKLGDMDVFSWLGELAERTGSGLLLDCGHVVSHQLVAGRDLTEGLERLPLNRVVEMHVAGGVIQEREGRRLYIDAHDLPPMVETNQYARGTAHPASAAAPAGNTTGISAADRARTISIMTNPQCMPEELVQPGPAYQAYLEQWQAEHDLDVNPRFDQVDFATSASVSTTSDLSVAVSEASSLRAEVDELRARAQQGDVGAQAEITALVADLPTSQGCAPEVVETEPEPTMPIPLENPGNPNQG